MFEAANAAERLSMDSDRDRVERALRREVLYGDDFAQEEIEAWFNDEREGYFNLYYTGGKASGKGELYEYEALANEHGFKWVSERRYLHTLGIGSADGAELRALLTRSDRITVLEPSENFSSTPVAGGCVSYVKPDPSGVMPFPPNTFDLIVCFNVLHHIPNVTTILKEIYRVLSPNGFALLREPTHSMGDWRFPRRGLTQRERGIPLEVFRDMLRGAKFVILRETPCMFSLTSRLSWIISKPVWQVSWIVRMDRVLCALPVWPRRYHARNTIEKVRPTAVAYVLSKRCP
jgi:SAM-dependent methyltransferase